MLVIILFNRRYIAIKTVEVLRLPLFVDKQSRRLFQFLVSFEAGKDKHVVAKVLRHDGRDDTAFQRRADSFRKCISIRIYKSHHPFITHDRRIDPPHPSEYPSESLLKDSFVNWRHVDIVCRQCIHPILVKGTNPKVPPRDCGGAYPKKPSCVPRLPVTSMPNLVRIQSGSIS